MSLCDNCNGACCRWLLIGNKRDMHRDDIIFFLTRGCKEMDGALWRKDVCPKLADNGRCSIYPKRPLTCAAFKMGGAYCLSCRKLEYQKDD